MSKKNLAILILAGIVIVFVIARIAGLDRDFPSSKQGEIKELSDVSPYSSWVKYQSKEHDFSILFPRMPQHLHEEEYDDFGLFVKVYDIYAAFGFDAIVYMVEVIEYPKEKDFDDRSKIYKEALDDILTNSRQNKLIESKEGEFKGEMALHFTIENSEKLVYGTLFTKERTLFILTKVAPKSLEKETGDYDFFIDSLSIGDNKNQKENL